jgi:uncharacterized protein YndB with AHSA1/START domain
MTQETDRIQKRVVLRAPRERVWRAVSDAKEFGTWFGVEFDGPFVAGERLAGRIVPTKADPEIAKAQEPYSGMACDVVVQRIEPMTLFSFKWHPNAVEPASDYAKEPMTLVTFELEETAGGTLLTITESGFDAVPLARRAEAFTQNEEGWQAQTKLIQKYVEGVQK